MVHHGANDLLYLQEKLQKDKKYSKNMLPMLPKSIRDEIDR
jgi:hypothetical protein